MELLNTTEAVSPNACSCGGPCYAVCVGLCAAGCFGSAGIGLVPATLVTSGGATVGAMLASQAGG